MARIGNVDYSELRKFADQLEKGFNEEQIQRFIENCAKELAARFLREVTFLTPVGVYPDRVGGTLRRGWTAEQQQDIAMYVQSLRVNRVGDTYVIEIVNPVEYAAYVEYGHRQQPGRYVPAIGKRLKKAWVEGKGMMKKSVEHIQGVAPEILEKRLQEKLGEILR